MVKLPEDLKKRILDMVKYSRQATRVKMGWLCLDEKHIDCESRMVRVKVWLSNHYGEPGEYRAFDEAVCPNCLGHRLYDDGSGI